MTLRELATSILQAPNNGEETPPPHVVNPPEEEMQQRTDPASPPALGEYAQEPSAEGPKTDSLSRCDSGELSTVNAPLAMSNDELRALAEQDLFVFAKGILGYSLLDEKIHLPLCRLLEQYETKRRLVIVLPRSWFKTTLCSIAYPIWRAVRSKGNVRILLVQNTYDNACAKLKSIKDQWETNELLRSLWPELVPGPQSKWTSDSLCLTRTESWPESTFECGGIRQVFISRHYDLIIEDDTVAPKLSELGEENVLPVKEDIGQAIGFHGSCSDLQNNFATAQIMVVGTRWFEKDLISHIADELNPKLASTGALAYELHQRACLENSEGVADVEGEPTFAARFPREVLAQLKAEKGSYMFSCNPAEAPILMADMSCKPISEIQVGDTVVGFTTSKDGKANSTLTPTKVLAIGNRKDFVWKITLKSGRSIRCTIDHKWVDANAFKRRHSGREFYKPAWIGMKLAYVCDPLPKYESDPAWECYLAGLFDGEGSVSISSQTDKYTSRSGHLSIAQCPNHNPEVSQWMRVALQKCGFTFDDRGDHLVFGTSWEDRRKFVHLISCAKASKVLLTMFCSKWIKEEDEVVKIEPDREETVYSFQTETGNYICWGYASKNCLYLNLPLRSDDMPFRSEWFRYYDQPPLDLYTYTTVDPAGDPEETVGEPDFNVVLTAGVDIRTGRKYVLHYDREKCSPSKLIELIFTHVRSFGPEYVGIETVQYQKSIMHYLKLAMREREIFFAIKPLRNAGKGKAKAMRIRGLQPGFEQGNILLRTHHNALMSEALAFPYGKNDDVLDALAMQLELWALMRKDRPATPKFEPEPHTLEGALAAVAKKREVHARRTRILGIVNPGSPVGRIRYRNGRMAVV